MPKPNYKSITVKDESYDKLHSDYLKYKESLKLNGIFSFSAYVESLSGTNPPTSADDLKEILCIQTQVLIIMSDYMLGADKETCQTNQLRAKQHMFEFLKTFQEKDNE